MKAMKVFVLGVLTVGLYLITALVTGLHNFYGLMNMVNGAPLNLLNCAALFGSAALVVAAVLMSFQSRIAPKIGFAGSVLLWVYYAPLLIVSVVMPFTTRTEIRTLISDREMVPLLGILLGPVLLIACTVHSLLTSRLRRHRVNSI
jgi:hypothetical protein